MAKGRGIYEIYPQSFYDTNKDDIGDFNGIIEKLDYIKSLGCNALWINPCFDSPYKAAGYDVRDYKKVAARYCTNNDLYRLFDEAHKEGMEYKTSPCRWRGDRRGWLAHHGIDEPPAPAGI